MGCWNGTCMISNLSIRSGEKIKVVLLQKGYYNLQGQAAYVYSGDILSPAFLPISGEYNDYGCIEDIVEDWNYKLIEKKLKEIYGTSLMMDEHEVDDWNLQQFIDGIERGNHRPMKYKFKDEWRLCDMSFVMIREDVWKATVKVQSKRKGYWNDEKRNSDDPKVPYYIDGATWIDRKFKEMVKTFKEYGDLDKFSEDSEFANASRMLLRYTIRDIGIFKIHGEGKGLLASTEYTERCHQNIKKPKLLKDIFKRWAELSLVEGLLSGARKGWMIQPGAGSQEDNWKLTLELSKEIAKISDKLIKENQYEMDEQEED